MTGYTQQEYAKEVLQLFDQMRKELVSPDLITFGSVMKAYSSIGSFEYCRQVHNCMIQRGLDTDSSIGNALIDMYANRGALRMPM